MKRVSNDREVSRGAINAREECPKERSMQKRSVPRDRGVSRGVTTVIEESVSDVRGVSFETDE